VLYSASLSLGIPHYLMPSLVVTSRNLL
jgi:hypothetical protein